MRTHSIVVPFLAIALLLSACASKYVTPGARADFHAMGISQATADERSDADVQVAMNRKPAAGFPAAIVAVRVQGREYRSMSASSYGHGAFSVVTTRDVENPEDIARLEKLPMVQGVGTLNRLVLPERLETTKDLRLAAANVQADIVLLYTFDTTFHQGDTTIPALGVISLGLIPNEVQKATSTASAAFIDTRTGYIYGLCEATAKKERLSNAWTSREALDRARRGAETDAFHQLVDQMEQTWTGIAARYGPPASATPVAAAAVEVAK